MTTRSWGAGPRAPRRDRPLLGLAHPVRRDGRGHIYGVIGPDEYHEPVDDNAFTNVMARWNLRRAAELAVVDPERARGLARRCRRARGRVGPANRRLRAVRRLHELEPLVIADVAPRRPIAADLLLGAERVPRRRC